MALIPITIPPGIFRNGTEYQSRGRWFDANLVRWYEGTVMPFGGWLKKTATVMEGPGRGIITWRPQNFTRQAGIGTVNSLRLWDDNSLLDITPTAAGLTDRGVWSGATAYVVGDLVSISLAGVTTKFRCILANTNNTPPNTTYWRQFAALTAGLVDTIYGTGYGFGTYGSGNYGSGSGTGATEATTWSMAIWGDRLVAVASHDKNIFQYDNDSNQAQVVPNSPTCKALMVTADRILVALGSLGDLRHLSWCDVENNQLWTPAYNNTAGDYRLQTDGTIVTGLPTKGTNLVWTTTDLHKFTFIGQPLIYRFERVSGNCGLVAPLAVQSIEGGAIWMGQKNFFRYAGGQVFPLPCEIHDYVFGDINLLQLTKVSSGHIAAFGEVLFFYCSANSTAINRCVSYNYREDHWNIVSPDGTLARGCWADVGAFNNPLAVSDAGILYDQELGWTNDGTPLLGTRYAQTGPIELGNGDQIMEATQLLPDEKTNGQMQVLFAQKFTPEGPVYNRGPYTVAPYTNIRVSARQVAMKLQSVVDADFRFGTQRVEASPGGAR